MSTIFRRETADIAYILLSIRTSLRTRVEPRTLVLFRFAQSRVDRRGRRVVDRDRLVFLRFRFSRFLRQRRSAGGGGGFPVGPCAGTAKTEQSRSLQCLRVRRGKLGRT